MSLRRSAIRVLYLDPDFNSRDDCGSNRFDELVHGLRDDGYDVLVVTSTAGMPHLRGRRNWGVVDDNIDGIPVRIVPAGFFRLTVFSILAAVRGRRPDAIVATRNAWSVWIPALAGRLLRGIPLVSERGDYARLERALREAVAKEDRMPFIARCAEHTRTIIGMLRGIPTILGVPVRPSAHRSSETSSPAWAWTGDLETLGHRDADDLDSTRGAMPALGGHHPR